MRAEGNYKFVNNNKQPQAIKGVCAYKLLVIDLLTMKLGRLSHHEFIETEITSL